MTEKLDAVVPKLVPLIRMLSSTAEREVLNAVRALLRLLASVGLDIHALAERVEHGGDEPLSAAEMQRIYDKGFEDGFAKGAEHGRRSAVIAAQPIGVFATRVDSGVNGYSWQQIAAALRRQQASCSTARTSISSRASPSNLPTAAVPRRRKRSGCAICSCASLAGGSNEREWQRLRTSCTYACHRYSMPHCITR